MNEQEQRLRMEAMERAQGEIQEELARSQQEALELRAQLAKSQEEARGQFAAIMALLQVRAHADGTSEANTQQTVQTQSNPPFPPGFTPPFIHNQDPQGSRQQNSDNVHNNVHDLPRVEIPIREGQERGMVPDFDEELRIARKDESKRFESVDAQDKYKLIEERLRAVEGGMVPANFDAQELSLVTGLIIPPKFKIPVFDKFSGASDPIAHLTMYCRKMAAYAHDDKMLIHYFQDSLSGSASRWYNQLTREKVPSWRHLAQEFLGQYKHVSDLAPDRLTLSLLEKKSSESFKEYAQRWRDLSTQVQPPLTNKETTVMFVNTLKAPFYERLVGSATKDFSDLVISGEMIESAIKSGKMEISERSGSTRSPPHKKKEGETYAVAYGETYAQQSYPSFYSAPKPHYLVPRQSAFPSNRPAQTNNRSFYNTQGPNQNQKGPNRESFQFTSIPISYSELYPKLIESHLVAPKYIPPLQPKNGEWPKWYDANAQCIYHAGIVGHSVDNCPAFKRVVQSLIDAGVLSFDAVEKANVFSNPFPDQGGVNAILKEE